VRLRELTRPAPPVEQVERCDLCGEPVPAGHRHLIDLRSRELLCACTPCKILFEQDAAGGGHFRLIGERRLALEGFELDDVRWADLRLPVDMAFFFHSSEAGRVVAYYPSPMGATESMLDLAAWEEIERANPVLATLEPDVEALLVNRARDARDYLLVPIDACYRLVALMRTHWRGLTGGSEVWDEIDRFFREEREAAWPR
jgi:hypothetical protein